MDFYQLMDTVEIISGLGIDLRVKYLCIAFMLAFMFVTYPEIILNITQITTEQKWKSLDSAFYWNWAPYTKCFLSLLCLKKCLQQKIHSKYINSYLFDGERFIYK